MYEDMKQRKTNGNFSLINHATGYSATYPFSTPDIFDLGEHFDTRENGHQSSSNKTNGVVTNIGFDMSPRTKKITKQKYL
jgi:hypothetical protein